MNRRRFIGSTLFATTFAAGLSACVGTSTTLRYRLRLVVQRGGAVFSGVSIVELLCEDIGRSVLKLPDAPRFQIRSRGEAIAIDLGETSVLFGVLVPPDLEEGFSAPQILDVLTPLLPPTQQQDQDRWLQRLRALAGEFELPPRFRPVLVRFRNVNDRSSAETIEVNQLESVYGPGARFVSATISVTTEPLTTGIEKRLPWLSEAGGAMLVRSRDPTLPLAQRSVSERLPVRAFKIDGV